MLNRGPISATNLKFYGLNSLGWGQVFDISASDRVTNFSLSGGTSTLYSPVSSLTLSTTSHATTTTFTSVTGAVSLSTGSTLTIEAPLTLSGNNTLDVEQLATLDMGGYPLSASSVYFGWFSSLGISVLNRGPISTAYLEVYGWGQEFDISASDRVTNFSLSGGTSTLNSPVASLTLSTTSHATTTPAASVTGAVTLNTGSKLTLGASMTLSGALDVEQYSTLDMGGNPLSASAVYLGFNFSQPVTVLNRGAITTANLYVYGGQTFDISASDAVTNLTLSSGTSTLYSPVSSLTLSNTSHATTTPAASVTGNVTLNTGSTLTMGAPLTLSGQKTLDVEQYSTLDMGGNPLSAYTVSLGYSDKQPITVLNRGPISATNLNVYGSGQEFDISASDRVTNFSLSGGTSTLNSPVASLTLSTSAQAWTTPSASVTGAVTLNAGSKLTLGASMMLSGVLDVEQYSTLDMGGNPLSASAVYLGFNFSQPVTVLNRGAITTANLYVYGGQTFDISASDAVTNLTLSSGTSTLYSPVSSLTLSNTSHATTTPAASVTGNVTLNTGSTLTMGAPLTLSGQKTLDVEQYSTLDMGGNPLSAYTVSLGYSDKQPITVLNRGPISATNLNVYGSGQEFDISAFGQGDQLLPVRRHEHAQ